MEVSTTETGGGGGETASCTKSFPSVFGVDTSNYYNDSLLFYFKVLNVNLSTVAHKRLYPIAMIYFNSKFLLSNEDIMK